ncbi:Pyruvate kinase 2 [Taenia crassiceps]|uniref:Pyruvate kinase 2 n=1 Tax=Taenia crassiceps TaxID=6207 RepID=A0ABR4QMG2_9CEST
MGVIRHHVSVILVQRSAISIAPAGPCCPVIAITRYPRVGRHCRAYSWLFPFVYTGERLDIWSEDMDL